MFQLPGELAAGFLVALGGGLLIGVERERRKGAGADRALAGVRTFTLAALAGAIAQALGQPWLVFAGAALVVVLNAVAYARSRREDPGVTTEIALFVTYLLGVAAIAHPAAAAGAAVVVAALLAARGRLHRFATEVLTERELRDAMLFAGAALVLLPLLPDAPIAWLGGTNPHNVWTFAVLIMAMQASGYIAQRWLGARRGLALSGFTAGFVSSTAAVAALGARVRSEPAQLDASVSGALFSSISTYIQFALIAGAIHWPALLALAAPLAAGLAATALAAVWVYRHARGADGANEHKGRPFNLLHAAAFAAGIATLGALLGAADTLAGNTAVQFGAALAGLLDAHAPGASLVAMAADGRLAAGLLAPTCLMVLSTNALAKTGAAYASGGARYAARVGAGLAGGIAAGWGALLLVQ